jgi:hypothetical protein
LNGTHKSFFYPGNVNNVNNNHNVHNIRPLTFENSLRYSSHSRNVSARNSLDVCDNEKLQFIYEHDNNKFLHTPRIKLNKNNFREEYEENIILEDLPRSKSQEKWAH